MMKTLVLAAGYATRLYPLTENFPKPLLEVQGKTILDWLLADIAQGGLSDECVVVSNHRFASHFQEWADSKEQKVTVVDDGSTSNDSRLGAVCDIAFAMEALQLDDELLVIAGDNLLDFSLNGFLRYAAEKKSSCVMRFYQPDKQKLLKAGVLVVDEKDRVLRMTEKSPEPESHWICPPFYFFTREDARRVREGIAAGCGTDAPGSFIAWLCTQATVHAMEMPGLRYDIGDLQSYKEVQREYKGIVK